jgi:hypothetical protein
MTCGDEELKERFLRADALGPHHPEPDVDAITRRGRGRRVRLLVSIGFVGCLLAVTLVGSLVVLAPTDGRSGEPLVRPGADTSDWSGAGTIAEGTDPFLGRWRLFVPPPELAELGELAFEVGRGGGSVPLSQPPGPIRTVGFLRRVGHPAAVNGIVDSSVTAVAVLSDGERYDATLIALPDDLLPDASFFFAGIPDRQPLDGPWPEGEVVAYDASGNELDRFSFGDIPEIG